MMKLSDEAIHRELHASPLDSSKFLSNVMRLNDCTTSAELHAELQHLSRVLGFDSFLYGGRFRGTGSAKVEKIESNYDADWRREYDKLEYASIDPTVAHSLVSLVPFIWSDQMYGNVSQQAFREEAHHYGLLTGVTFPIQNKEGGVAMLSLAMSSKGSEARGHIREMLMWGPLLATLAHEAMSKIVKNGLKNGREAAGPRLTKRENDVLQWIAAGKSTWEISRVLCISEHGVIHHVRNLLHKFDVTSRHQAVLKALSSGLI
ncbi:MULTISPECIES: helix-turn-helix transcriptional regulator [unclassified Janthinobacterium]|uniref:helix-turn-helix transcriptional regulator n=1 Tax=unclassified Janthinobacterium TaxID=2610881 RepID=UPI00034C750B|nr:MULTISPECIES: LuxR family transcriptional regulator [unclassified Janthinobacterium]MEC5160169.1 LuxR family quorum-sensing transcriptional regulator LasR [Janthinobacterium sp. CG_S6]